MNIKILFLLITMCLFKDDDTEPKNKKLNAKLSDDGKSFELDLEDDNKNKVTTKLSFDKQSENIINKKIYDCDKNKCEEGNKDVCTNGESKKTKFKIYEDEKDFWELNFCYVTDDKTKSQISNTELLDVLHEKLKEFNVTIGIDYSDFEYKEKEKLNSVEKYTSFNYIINPDLKSDDDLINNEKFNLNLTINGDGKTNSYIADKVDFNLDLNNAYDFKIQTSENISVIGALTCEYLKKITKTTFTIKNVDDKNKNFPEYKKNLKDIIQCDDDKIKKKLIIFEQSQTKGTFITVGTNFIKKNVDLFLEIKEKEFKVLAFKKSNSKTVVIVIIIVVCLIVAAILCLIFLKVVKKKKVEEEDEDMEYVKQN